MPKYGYGWRNFMVDAAPDEQHEVPEELRLAVDDPDEAIDDGEGLDLDEYRNNPGELIEGDLG